MLSIVYEQKTNRFSTVFYYFKVRDYPTGKEPVKLKGKKVTSFTNTEEDAVQLTDVVPFLVEDMLKENGGIYSKKGDWEAYAVEDGLLITGQNPASSEVVAEHLLKRLA